MKARKGSDEGSDEGLPTWVEVILLLLEHCLVAAGETVILLHPPLPLLGVSTRIKKRGVIKMTASPTANCLEPGLDHHQVPEPPDLLRRRIRGERRRKRGRDRRRRGAVNGQ